MMGKVEYRVLRRAELKTVPGAIIPTRPGSADLAIPSAIFHVADHVKVQQNGYARLDANSPVKGLASENVDSCCAFVFHCPATGRVILAHTPSFYHFSNLVPLVYWVSGGNDEILITSRLLWVLGPVAWPSTYRPGVPVYATIFKGSIHAQPNSFEHEWWQKCIDKFFAHSQARLGLDLIVNHVEEPLPIGALRVDKAGVVTVFKAAGQSGLLLAPMTDLETIRWCERAMFIGCFYAARNQEYPIWMQYDGQASRAPPTMPDSVREHLRALLADLAPPTTASHSDFASLKKEGGLLIACELCCQKGSKLCSNCNGAWYCGAVHQKQDWKDHKTWCKAHPWK